jgi:pyridoxine/pyridoxamine 5'-phosphate oxidase
MPFITSVRTVQVRRVARQAAAQEAARELEQQKAAAAAQQAALEQQKTALAAERAAMEAEAAQQREQARPCHYTLFCFVLFCFWRREVVTDAGLASACC